MIKNCIFYCSGGSVRKSWFLAKSYKLNLCLLRPGFSLKINGNTSREKVEEKNWGHLIGGSWLERFNAKFSATLIF